MIKSVKLKFGRSPASAPEPIETTPVTVFVGPNYSGKSKVLQEIQRFASSGTPSTTDVILGEMEFVGMAADVAERRVEAFTLKPHIGDTLAPGEIIVGRRGSRFQIPRLRLVQALINPASESGVVCEWFLAYNTMMLDGKSRIGLVQQQAAGDLQSPAHTSFQVLFRDDAKRYELQRIIHEAFGIYLVIDPTNLGYLRLRMSATAARSPIVERGIHDESVRFHGAALPIEIGSDGLKAFTGMMTEIIAGDPAILLVDEPEAFLHPALAFLLGKEVARATAGSEKRLFVSTHSANFLMGCIQSGVPITVIRLTYRDGVATGRTLPNAEIFRLMRNPLLRSTGVLSGLFYENVVVTESDADRAFYQEINERLLRDRPTSGIPNCLFLNAQNKQTVPTIMRPLRQLGIPTAGIVDVDVLKDGGSTWTSFMTGAYIPEVEQQPTATLRGSLKAKLEATFRDMKRDGGIALLSGTDREAAENLLQKLADYGLFVVPGGELESWLRNLGATSHGPQWLINVFEKLGEDPESQSYVHAGSGDVWTFIEGVKTWFTTPDRRGIPS